ncbi:hypothetical protein [Chryseobacterium gambrini]|uniref:Uncharacterized protein n=1 Tax=Chryseobacterium gambrini TaxID=373672 RepID=A0A1N7MWB8_9FLAO|nr:hypothetical protein [Chryseobacterium gambrini]SIS90434.1 hypothetical protein SAMN05421785_103550 [Chryseobacterium gambrini]
MKTKILLVVLCIIMLSCKSVTETQTIKYDFSKGEFTGVPIKPVQGQPVIIKIDSINNLFYKVSIDAKDIAIKDKNLFGEEDPPKSSKSPEPADPKKLNAPAKIEQELLNPKNQKISDEKINTRLSKHVLDLEKEIENNSALIKKNESEKTNLENMLQTVNQQLSSVKSLDELKIQMDTLKSGNNKIKKELQKMISKRNELETNQSGYKNEIEKIEKKISEYVNRNRELNGEVLKIADQDKSAKDLITDYLSKIKNMYTNLYQSANAIYKINDNYNNYIDKVYSAELTLGEYKKIKNYVGLENPVIIKTGKLNECNSEVNKFDSIKTNLLMKFNDTELDKIKDQLSKFSDGQSLISKLNEDILTIRQDVTDLSKTVNDLNIRKKLNYVESLDRILLKAETYTYTSPPIQGYEDYLKFNINITARSKAEDGKYIIDRLTPFEYKEYIKGGIRFDFSIGTVFDIGNKQQEFEVIQDVMGYKIVQKTNNQYIPTIAGMLHSSWRSSNNFAFGFTLGVSMDMTKLQLNSLFPGISLLVGRTDKIIFTIGPALRKVTELQNGFIIDRPLSYSPQDYTAESYKLGWFVGISWNLTAKQRSLMRLD